MRPRVRLVLAALVPAARVPAQEPALGPISTLNAYTTQKRLQPSVATSGSGGFVIAWDNGYAPDIPIHARRYDGDAQPLEDQVLIGNGLGPVLARRELMSAFLTKTFQLALYGP